MPTTPLKEVSDLWKYIQHLILESEYEYDDDDEVDNPLDEDNWLLQTRGKYNLPIKSWYALEHVSKGRK